MTAGDIYSCKYKPIFAIVAGHVPEKPDGHNAHNIWTYNTEGDGLYMVMRHIDIIIHVRHVYEVVLSGLYPI